MVVFLFENAVDTNNGIYLGSLNYEYRVRWIFSDLTKAIQRRAENVGESKSKSPHLSTIWKC
jgi:hypothetical protein